MTTITLTNDQTAALKALLVALTASNSAAKTVKPSKVVKLPTKTTAIPASKADRKAAFAGKVVVAFAKAGVKVTPNVDVFTYNLWLAKGFKVKPGQHSVRVDGVPMFHKGQVAKV